MCLAVPGKVVSVEENDLGLTMGRVNFGGILKEVCLAYVPEARIGDYVIVHVGFALNTIDEAEAQAVFETLREMDELGELEIPRPDERESPGVKYIDEYRSEEDAQRFVRAIERTVSAPRTVMEICGGQTHTIIKTGIDRMLPQQVDVVHGPGCPVCVTPLEMIDRAIAIALRPEVIFTSFGDMLRVPGSTTDLLSVKAQGGDVRMVYSPLDAVKLAAAHPDRQVVFFAVGFETTAPANATAVWQAKRQGVENFSILCSHVLVPPAIEAILGSPQNRVEGFLAAGHVCTVMGYREYEPLAEKYRVPIVVTGFEPLDLLQGLYMTLKALEEKRWGVENQYSRAVTRDGNRPAQRLLQEVFETCDRAWRGIGVVPGSGFRLGPAYADFDAERRFGVSGIAAVESPLCIAGDILQGLTKPSQCTQFDKGCTPDHPLGAPMVSSEGACAAYHRYGRET